ncbi:alanyl-tRNA editing protein [Aneurinibacillus aneurinilyticus]|jgi:alanyl-tRNA synthetase/misacylated tRNA(Ala) deacylase|uniref:alanyl-tRNA editing protein n=1 Tax=Aneurinibacillus aneurinilyticus TaxID=1391 RepID=UPI0023F3F4FA|nr:alanyl-tRNA editing protein [Aneurinibacillus aneurinilyticus]MCI1696389.1 alanyl-tRNA editing protein [Aneurinibacillus aneurinilyticus]
MKTMELYAENSYIKECEVQIVSLNGRLVVFDRTIFYPGGGGQPCDKGFIKQGDEIYEVVNVKRIDGEIIHELDRPLQDTQQEVIMKIDWSWRFQNMRYHTLLHVIAGYLYQHYNALATSSQIEKDQARLELAFTPEIIEKIPFEQLEQSIKNLLAQTHNVHMKTISRREAEQKEGTIKTIINLLPASLNEIRIIQIDDIDEQACGGTHVNNTTEIGDFSIVKIQNKGATKKRLKIQLL